MEKMNLSLRSLTQRREGRGILLTSIFLSPATVDPVGGGSGGDDGATVVVVVASSYREKT